MAFSNFIKRWKSKQGERMVSWETIKNTTNVNPDFTKYLLVFKESSCIILYVDLQAPDRNFAVKPELFNVSIN